MSESDGTAGQPVMRAIWRTARSLLLAVALTAGCGGGGGGASLGTGRATLTWMAPTTHRDGTPLEDLAGYRIYYYSQDQFIRQIDLDNPSAIMWTVTGLVPGTWYFSMTAIDSSGQESYASNVVSKTI